MCWAEFGGHKQCSTSGLKNMIGDGQELGPIVQAFCGEGDPNKAKKQMNIEVYMFSSHSAAGGDGHLLRWTQRLCYG